MKLKKVRLLSVMAVCTLLAIQSCSGSKKDDPMAGKKIVCDSIPVSFFDSTGSEYIKKELHCDTLSDP